MQGCQIKSLGRLRYQATASPEYIRRHFPDGVTPEAISAAPALTFNQKDRLQQQWVQDSIGQQISFPTHWLPSSQGFVDGALAGMGWGLNPIHLIRDHLASGRLVELIPGSTRDVSLFWQTNHLAAPHIATLTRAVVEQARRALS